VEFQLAINYACASWASCGADMNAVNEFNVGRRRERLDSAWHRLPAVLAGAAIDRDRHIGASAVEHAPLLLELLDGIADREANELAGALAALAGGLPQRREFLVGQSHMQTFRGGRTGARWSRHSSGFSVPAAQDARRSERSPTAHRGSWCGQSGGRCGPRALR
jgi:hypothetical protein